MQVAGHGPVRGKFFFTGIHSRCRTAAAAAAALKLSAKHARSESSLSLSRLLPKWGGGGAPAAGAGRAPRSPSSDRHGDAGRAHWQLKRGGSEPDSEGRRRQT